MATMVEDIDLPYDYNDNSRAGNITIAAVLVISSIVMGCISYFGFFAIPWWVAVLPAAYVVHRSYTFSLLRNAMHEAIRDADMDRRLDRIIEVRTEAQQSERRVLNAETFNRKLIEEKAA